MRTSLHAAPGTLVPPRSPMQRRRDWAWRATKAFRAVVGLGGLSPAACVEIDPSYGDSTTSTATASESTDDGLESSESTEGACLVVNPPRDLVLGELAFPRTAPTAGWTVPEPGCSAVVEYELSVGTTAGSNDLFTRIQSVAASSWDGALDGATRLPLDAELFVSVRAIDTIGQVSEPISASFQVWTPRELPGLITWLDFADVGTLFTDACSTPATHGDVIRCVLDKSGNDSLMLEPPGLTGPVLLEDSIEGLSSANFAGDAILVSPDASAHSPGGEQLTMAVLDAPVAIAGTELHRYVLHKDQEYQCAYFSERIRVAIRTVVGGNWNWGNLANTTTTGPQFNVITHDTDIWSFRRNGSAQGSIKPVQNQVGTIRSSDKPLYLGARVEDEELESFAYTGLQGEVVLAATALDEEQTENLERYISEKWGVF